MTEKLTRVSFYMGDRKIGSTLVNDEDLKAVKQARWVQHHGVTVLKTEGADADPSRK